MVLPGHVLAGELPAPCEDQFQYVGCYKDDSSRDLKHGPKTFGYTPASCQAACPTFQYFALQDELPPNPNPHIIIVICVQHHFMRQVLHAHMLHIQDGGQCFCDNSFSTPAREYPREPDYDCTKTWCNSGKHQVGMWRARGGAGDGGGNIRH